MKYPPTLAGIEPATFRFVAQHLNHCATAVPINLCGVVLIPNLDKCKMLCRCRPHSLPETARIYKERNHDLLQSMCLPNRHSWSFWISLGSVMSIRSGLCIGNHYFYRMCFRTKCAVYTSQLVGRDFWSRIPSVYIHLPSHWHFIYSIVSGRSQLIFSNRQLEMRVYITLVMIMLLLHHVN